MNKIKLVKRVVVTGGCLYLFAAPTLAFGQSSPRGEAPHPPMKSALPSRGAPPPPDLLAALTLTDDQKTKIDQIREDTKSRLAAVASDKRLSPETADAMMRGYQRIENGKIFEVLTPEQQVDVRKRMSAWRAAAGPHKYPLKQLPAPESSPQPKQ